MRYELRAYEHVVQEATQGGLFASLTEEPDALRFENEAVSMSSVTTERWSVIQAVFFASTVLTTIGICMVSFICRGTRRLKIP